VKRIALALFASLFVVGCGFVDESIHMSDEELEAEMGFGSGGIGMSGRGISSGCGGIHIHGRGHHSRHYNFGYSSIRGRRPTVQVRSPKAVGGIDPLRESASAAEIAPEEPKPRVDPVPRDIETWGQILEWHFRHARQRGEVDDETVAAMEAMR
jgi:hypothetical protein